MTAIHMRGRLLLSIALTVLAVPSAALAERGFSMKLGSTFTITGRTGSAPGHHTRALGKVVLSGRWVGGKWHVFTTTVTDNAGYYRFAFKPGRRGTLMLRIAPPDHHLRLYLLHVR
jgi:hypothetical protein